MGEGKDSAGWECGARSGGLGSDAVVGGVNRKQRWSRDAYNAYQREYMRKRRARG
jgi:hypothetical protein